MIVGAVAGLPNAALRPWCASARKVFSGHIALICDEPSAYLNLGEEYGITVWPGRELKNLPGVCMISRERWKALADFLDGLVGPRDQPVVFADTRDVVFQSDPHEAIGRLLVIGGEGKQHDENEWCLGWLKTVYPDEWQDIAPLEVLNAGVIGGPAELLREFALALYAQLPAVPCECKDGAQHMADQTVVNHLCRHEFGTRTSIRHDWVFHVRSMDHQRIPAAIDEASGRLLRRDDTPFPIVHQFDLAPQLAHFQEIR